MAGDADAAQAQQRGALGAAACVGVRAARVEGTARRWVEGVGHLALHRGARAARVVHLGDGVEQHARVGVARGVEQGVLVGQLHQAAQVHHAHLVAHMAHHGQVVADEQIGQLALALQVFHDVEHLRLHRHIQRAGGLVADQKLGLGGQGASDGDALALAAGELVREAVQRVRIQPYQLHQLARSLQCLGFGGAVVDRALDDRLADRAAWVQ